MALPVRAVYIAPTGSPAQDVPPRSFTAERLAGDDATTVSVCLPARNEAATIGPILERLMPLRERGVIDQVVVADDSTDGTGEIARASGAEVVRPVGAAAPSSGRCAARATRCGARCRSLTGDVVCFLDADSEDFGEHFALGLIGPLLLRRRIAFVKGFYRRPLQIGDDAAARGRRPRDRAHRAPAAQPLLPELAGVLQPLAGEIAARPRAARAPAVHHRLRRRIALLIDAWRDASASTRSPRSTSTCARTGTSRSSTCADGAAVLAAVMSRMEREGRIDPSGDRSWSARRPIDAVVPARARAGLGLQRAEPSLDRPPRSPRGRRVLRLAGPVQAVAQDAAVVITSMSFSISPRSWKRTTNASRRSRQAAVISQHFSRSSHSSVPRLATRKTSSNVSAPRAGLEDERVDAVSSRPRPRSPDRSPAERLVELPRALRSASLDGKYR